MRKLQVSGQERQDGPRDRAARTASSPTRPRTTCIYEAVINYQANQRRGTAATKTRSLVSGRRQEALAAEGHRPGPGGQHPLAALEEGRHDLRAEAEGLLLRDPQEGPAQRPQVGPVPEAQGEPDPGPPGPRPRRGQDQGRRPVAQGPEAGFGPDRGRHARTRTSSSPCGTSPRSRPSTPSSSTSTTSWTTNGLFSANRPSRSVMERLK